MERKARLLFVDDEERVVNLLRTMFRSDYEVFTATSGRQALEIISSQAIDVIVSDQRMPEMVGTELLVEVRNRSPATMRILLTGYSDLTAILGSVNDGEVFRFINKPWDHQEIKNTIAQAAAIARATGAAAAAKPAEGELVLAGVQTESPELLLLDDSKIDRQAMALILGMDYKVHGVSNIADALSILDQHDIGVIVAEARIGGSDTRELLRILKQHYPAITTVVTTQLADSDLVIKLINEAQVYRVVTKPIRSGLFQMVVSAAMKQHMRYCSKPVLVKRHALAASAEPENVSLTASVMRSLANLRQRMTRLMG